MQQTALEPHRLVRWSCVAGHPNWQHNTFSFTLEERNGETALQFVQQYAQELSDETYGTFNFNWGYYLPLEVVLRDRDGHAVRGDLPGLERPGPRRLVPLQQICDKRLWCMAPDLRLSASFSACPRSGAATREVSETQSVQVRQVSLPGSQLARIRGRPTSPW